MSRLVGYSSPTPSFVAPSRSDRNIRRVTTRPVRASWFQDADMSAHGAVLPGRLDPGRTAVFVCDVQERFRPVIHGFDHCVPAVVTEQNPERLGATVDELQPHLDPNEPAVAKKLFSMVTPEVETRLNGMNRDQAVLIGLESHVCVFQTAMDLMARGWEVHVLVDGVSSQRVGDRAAAMRRLEASGAMLSTSEMALFDLLKTAEADNFKAVSALVREKRPEPPLPSV
jgi:nicotinamidase-related amidase